MFSSLFVLLDFFDASHFFFVSLLWKSRVTDRLRIASVISGQWNFGEPVIGKIIRNDGTIAPKLVSIKKGVRVMILSSTSFSFYFILQLTHKPNAAITRKYWKLAKWIKFRNKSKFVSMVLTTVALYGIKIFYTSTKFRFWLFLWFI